MEQGNYVLIKIGKRKNIEDAFNKGYLYFNTIECFREHESAEIGDKNENIDILYQGGDDGELTIDDFPLTQGNGLINAIFDFPNEQKKYSATHIFCCSLLEISNINIEKRTFEIPDEMNEFGDCVILIHNVPVFFDRIKKAIQKFGAKKMYFGKIEYVDFRKYSGDIGLFKKDLKYSHQKEFRIAFECENKEACKLDVGNLKDIARIGYINNQIC
jgi:hypothetical protein